MKIAISEKEILLTTETLQDAYEIGKTVNFFDSQDIKYRFQREYMTLFFDIPLKKLFDEER